MKKTLILFMLCNFSLIQYGQIIADQPIIDIISRNAGLMRAGPDVEILASFIIPVGIVSKKGGKATFTAATVPLERYNFWLTEELQTKNSPVDVWTLNGRVIIKGHVSDLAFCEVFNLLGQKVMMTNLFDGELNTFNVSSVARGIYIVRVVDGLKIINRKLVLN